MTDIERAIEKIETSLSVIALQSREGRAHLLLLVQELRGEMEHAKRSIKQACLFAVEALPPSDALNDARYRLGHADGVKAAADAVAQVEVD